MQPRRHTNTKPKPSSRLRAFVAAWVFLVLVFPIHSQSVVPGKDWDTVATPESLGFSSARLAALRGWLASIDTTAMMVVVGGRPLFTYGDLTHVSYLASGRKSILALLYGRYV